MSVGYISVQRYGLEKLGDSVDQWFCTFYKCYIKVVKFEATIIVVPT